jgi:hypothetical protein
MAQARGVKPSELLEVLPSIPAPPAPDAELENRLRARFNPPAGFRMPDTAAELEEAGEVGPDFGGFWDGPTFEGEKWKVTSHWSVEQGVTFYVDGDRNEAIRAVEAGKITAALAEVAAMVSA